MSGYNGRRGPNVSQYIANLNTIHSPEDTLESPQDLNLDPDLALFAAGSDQFVDWNAGTNLDLHFDQHEPSHNTSAGTSETNMDYSINSGNFDFADLNFTNLIANQPMPNLSHGANPYGASSGFTSPINTAVSPMAPGFDHSAGKKRRLDSLEATSQHPLDEPARVAAEEDKRRRNTAASARFRVKKKQREQALEKTAKEMTDRVSVLETRIQQLETENTWLKSLITEKNGANVSTSELSALKKLVEANASERSNGNHTDGVGTKVEETKA